MKCDTGLQLGELPHVLPVFDQVPPEGECLAALDEGHATGVRENLAQLLRSVLVHRLGDVLRSATDGSGCAIKYEEREERKGQPRVSKRSSQCSVVLPTQKRKVR